MVGMSQAPTYTRATGFANDERDNVGGRSTVRTAQVDAELDAISTSINALVANVALNQRDDGEIRDGRVKIPALASDVLALLISYDATPRGAWLTATEYSLKDLVTQSTNTYIATAPHVSGTFATDLAAGKWLLLALGTTPTASGIPFTPTTNISASTIQGAIEESDTENRVLSAAALAASVNLAADLADFAASAKGSGMVGYGGGVTYPANSIGAALQALGTAGASSFGLDVLSMMPEAKRAAIIAGTSTDDHLADVQAIINTASFTTTRQLRFRAGKWNFSAPPRLYYHAADNSGYNSERNAKWELLGEGRAQENYAIYSSPHGTIFNLQAATGDGFIVSPASLDASPFLGRDFTARDITFVGGPSGYLVRCNGVPQARFYNCDFVQTSATGNGLHISTAYFGGLFGCRFRTTVTPSGNTAITLTVNSTDAPGAGLFKIADTDIQGHSTSFHFQSGSWTNINFDNAEFRSYSGGRGVYIEGFLDQLTMDGCYFEGAGVNWIADAGAERLKSLVMTGCWGVGRALTGSAAIDITEPDAVTITSGTYQDLVLPFLRIQGVPDSASSRGSYQMLGPSFKFYDTVAAPLTLFSGIIPAIHGAEISGGATGISTVKLFNASTKWPIDGRPFFSANSSMMSAGHIRQTHSALISPAVSATLYTHASTEYAAVVMLATSSGTPVFELKNGVTAKLGDLFTVDIINVGGGTVTVRREVGATTILTLAANSKVRLFWSDLFNDWL